MKELPLLRNKKFVGIIIAFVLFLTCLLPVHAAHAAWPFAVAGVPYAVDGRILTPDKTGDISDWVEIARDGGYSLIVRKNFINPYPNTVMYGKVVYNDPLWQNFSFGATNEYNKSYIRDRINLWFNGFAPGFADKLHWNARLRDYSMHSNAKLALGTSCTHASVINGYSKPTVYQVGLGDDVAFALSYGESASFLSKMRFLRNNFINGVYVANAPSHPIAVANYNKINMPPAYLHFMWLRSPGDVAGTAASLSNNLDSGRVFQMGLSSGSNNTYGLIYPAMWVDSDIFGNNPNQNKTILRFPIPVDGRILPPNRTGDTSDWIEIARSENNSLIVRKNFINIYPNAVMYGNVLYNNPIYQYISFGMTDNYSTSFVRDRINAWFNGTNPITNQADRLPWNARLRNFTLQNNAKYVLGTSTTHLAVVNGFSMPSIYQQGIGDEVAFALSYGEMANFLSRTHFLRNNMINGVYIANQPSNFIAVKNYNKISIPSGYFYFMWGRSPGDIKGTVSALGNNNDNGRLFQNFLTPDNSGYGLVYPALWVGSGIFGDSATIIIRHVDFLSNELLEPETVVTVNNTPANYGPYGPKIFPNYGFVGLSGNSAPTSGVINANQTLIIVFMYAQTN